MPDSALLSRLARKSVNHSNIVRDVVSSPKLISELLAGLNSGKPRVKYGSAKVLRLLSECDPELLYPKFDLFVRLLDSENSFLKWDAMFILAGLAAVDSPGRLDRVLSRFMAPIGGDAMITAANAIVASADIALTRPHLAGRIAREILKVEQAQYQTAECRNVAIGHAILSLGRFFQHIDEKQPVVAFVTRQLENSRNATRKKAAAFLKKHERRVDGQCASG